jgi:hypothetical protein
MKLSYKQDWNRNIIIHQFPRLHEYVKYATIYGMKKSHRNEADGK